jgi:hypothetical protein
MLGQLQLPLITALNLSRIFIFSSYVITLQLFFVSLSLLYLRFDSLMLFKGNVINSEIRENSTTQVNI